MKGLATAHQAETDQLTKLHAAAVSSSLQKQEEAKATLALREADIAALTLAQEQLKSLLGQKESDSAAAAAQHREEVNTLMRAKDEQLRDKTRLADELKGEF